MVMVRSTACFAALVLSGSIESACNESPQSNTRVVVVATASEGVHARADGVCSVRLERSGVGGFLVLTVGTTPTASHAQELAIDVTGLAWADNQTLVYTTSPVYGQPGVSLWRCGTKEPETLVAPRNRNTAYPQGSDYFELVRLELGDVPRAVFLMTPDVDTTDFGVLREGSQHLFEVGFDGSGFGPYSPRSGKR